MDIDLVPRVAEKITEEAFESSQRAAGKTCSNEKPVYLHISKAGNWQIHSTSKLINIATSIHLTKDVVENEKTFKDAIADALELSIMPKSVQGLKEILEKRISPEAAKNITVMEMPLEEYNAALQHGALKDDEHGFYVKVEQNGKSLEMGIYETKHIHDMIDILNTSYPKKNIVSNRVDNALKTAGMEVKQEEFDNNTTAAHNTEKENTTKTPEVKEKNRSR